MISVLCREPDVKSWDSVRRALTYFGGNLSIMILPGGAADMASNKTSRSSRGTRMRLCCTAAVPLNNPFPGFLVVETKAGCSRQENRCEGRMRAIKMFNISAGEAFCVGSGPSGERISPSQYWWSSSYCVCDNACQNDLVTACVGSNSDCSLSEVRVILDIFCRQKFVFIRRDIVIGRALGSVQRMLSIFALCLLDRERCWVASFINTADLKTSAPQASADKKWVDDIVMGKKSRKEEDKTWRGRIEGLVLDIVPYQRLIKGSGSSRRNLVRISYENERLFYFRVDGLVSLENMSKKNAWQHGYLKGLRLHTSMK